MTKPEVGDTVEFGFAEGVRRQGIVQPPVPLSASDQTCCLVKVEGISTLFLVHHQQNRLEIVKKNAVDVGPILSALYRLTDEQRMDVFSHFCLGCGTTRNPCYCTRDE